MTTKTSLTAFEENRAFIFLLVFRWLSLLPVLFTADRMQAQPLLVFALALLANFVILFFNRPLNQIVPLYPMTLGIDLFFSALILFASGGAVSPYYLYALSPLLAGAFFFQMRGALLSSLIFTPLFIWANLSGGADKMLFVLQLTGIWLFPLMFAYPAALLRSVNRANADLARAHRQLEIIHDLTVLLQAAPDLLSVQERVLGAVTTDLGFDRAVVALVDPAREELGGWMLYPAREDFPRVKPLALKSENGAVIKALLNRETFFSADKTLVQDAGLDGWLARWIWFVVPLYLREHPVGVLLVDASALTPERESTLMTVANQAALALGTTILCIDRARRLAVETERNRIARDIHDTVAQSLFGITYSLEACINMLPAQAEQVKHELLDLRTLAGSAHDEVRRSVFDLWPSALTIELFMADLTNYINSCCRPHSFSIIFNHHGDFNSLSAGLRRAIYRMAQEALANSARHSGAQSARLCLTVAEHEVYLDISDQGKGFDLSLALSRSQNREHFGLHGIQERSRALGGECEIFSRPGMGARVMIALPVKDQRRD